MTYANNVYFIPLKSVFGLVVFYKDRLFLSETWPHTKRYSLKLSYIFVNIMAFRGSPSESLLLNKSLANYKLCKNYFLAQVLDLLSEEQDINAVTDYFSYEHFYVVYCKFWELDTDHDLVIDKFDLSRHANGGL